MSTERRDSNEGPDPITRVLASFSPAAPQIDRDRLMFMAGRASAASQEPGARSPELPAPIPGHLRSRQWLWPASTAALAATSLALALALFVRPIPGPQIVYVPRQAAAEAPQRMSEKAIDQGGVPVPAGTARADSLLPPDNYLRTREVALRMGLDAIGAPRAGGDAATIAPTYGSWLQGLDETPQRSPDAVPWFESLLNM